MTNHPYGITIVLEFKHEYTQEVERGTVTPAGLGFDFHQWCDLSQVQQEQSIHEYCAEWAKTRYETRWEVRDTLEYIEELQRSREESIAEDEDDGDDYLDTDDCPD